MKLINRSLCAVAALCLLSACTSDPIIEDIDTATVEMTVTVRNDHEFALEVLVLVNEHRTSLGLSSLAWNDDSENLATGHSDYMAQENEASHDNFFERSDYLRDRGANVVSENVAYGYQSAQAVLQGWLNSPSHKEALESNFTHTGIGIVQNENGINYYTQLFLK